MNAYQSDQPNLTYSDPAPVLLVARNETAMARARRAVEAKGLRIGAEVSMLEASARIKMQPSTSAVWVEIEQDDGPPMTDLLRLIDRDASGGRYAAVVSTTQPLLDHVEAELQSGGAELVVEATDVECLAALTIAIAQQQSISTYAEAPNDQGAERLRQLSEEVSRIASALARLSSAPNAPRHQPEAALVGDVPPISGDTVSKVIRGRRLRGKYFDETLFADPAWDMMLDLLQSEIAQHRVPVSNLCIAAAVPATTALRWLKMLVGQGLFVRRADPHDGRRVFVELAPETSHALRRYFAEVEQLATI